MQPTYSQQTKCRKEMAIDSCNDIFKSLAARGDHSGPDELQQEVPLGPFEDSRKSSLETTWLHSAAFISVIAPADQTWSELHTPACVQLWI